METFSKKPAAMQQAPGMRREATWGFQLSWYLYKDDDDDDDDDTKSGFLPQMSMRKRRKKEEGNSATAIAMKL